jgi:hypothetical protein
MRDMLLEETDGMNVGWCWFWFCLRATYRCHREPITGGSDYGPVRVGTQVAGGNAMAAGAGRSDMDGTAASLLLHTMIMMEQTHSDTPY